MTLPHIPDPIVGDNASIDAIEHVIVPRVRDIGDFEVHRALPAAERQMIGSFIFFDRFGPVMMKAGAGMESIKTRLAHTSSRTSEIYIKESVPEASSIDLDLPWKTV